ncbi:Protein unc-13-like protein C [Frankliniella fusca]|uniref:Protein unc-13-like protein C n=1 Tax=Frankliniella fusca TaxID=407009 RepID=A0AAE1LS65_9NEOP|nr:Protein unc-13-like protein C [Frankliniella fusca]
MSKPITRSSKVADMEKGELEALIMKVVQGSMKTVTDTLKTLSEDVASLKNELKDKDDKIRQLEASVETKLDELEQYGRRNNLRIFGVPVQADENTDDIVIEVACKMGISLDKSCIDRSHRIGKKDSHSKPIIVKFTSYAHRRSFFGAKRNLKGSRITVREDLTVLRMRLLREAVAYYSEKRVWTSDGVIKVKVGSRSPLSIKTLDDLKTLLRQFPPETLE